MSNGTRRPTARGNLRRQNTINGLTLAPPPPFLPVSIASNSSNNIEHDGSMNTSREQQKKKKKMGAFDDQVVPEAKRGTQHPVIEHNGFDDYYRSRLDAPVFRYSSSKNNSNNNDNNHNENRQNSQRNSNGNQTSPIVIE